MRFTTLRADEAWSARRGRDAEHFETSRELRCVDSPDMSGANRAAEANAAIAGRQQDLAEKQYVDAQARQAKFDPQFQQVIEQALKSQGTQDERSAEQWKLYQDIGMPAERRMADAAANFDTQGRRDAAAAEAVAGVDTQFQRGREGAARELGRHGVSLTSGRGATLDAATRFAQAKTAAGADATARRVTEATGLSLTADVANRGRGLTSTGLQAAGLALQGGSAATGGLSQNQATYNASLAPTQSFYGGAVNANNSAGSIYGNIANIEQQANQSALSGLAGLGSFFGQAAKPWIFSDPKGKQVHGKVDDKKALRSLEDAKVYDWTYKRGKGDGKRHIGRMAGEDDIDTPQGKGIDVISEMGKQHAAIRALSKKVDRLSLGDAKVAKRTKRTRAEQDALDTEGAAA